MSVSVDFDQETDFDAFETFQLRDSPNGLAKSSPLMHQRVLDALVAALEEGGLSQVESDPDVYVTYFTSTREEVRVNTSHYGYGYPGAWYWAAPTASTTTISTYEVGALVVDVWGRESNSLVWRGVSKGTIPTSPDRQARGIEKAIRRMVEESRAKM